MSTYKLFPSRAALRGSLSKDYPPVLTVNPGDTVAFQTLEADWRIRETDFKASEEGDFFTQRTERDAGHALCGPVAIRGARPGMALAVTVESIVPDTWGWSRVGGGDPDHLRRIGFSGAEYFLRWQIDVENRVCVSQRGHRVRMNPFMGVFAVAPAEVASARTHLPDRFGANLDCKEIVPGSTLYLPVFAEGALFSTGDGHAAQGDGECGCTAITIWALRLGDRAASLQNPGRMDHLRFRGGSHRRGIYRAQRHGKTDAKAFRLFPKGGARALQRGGGPADHTDCERAARRTRHAAGRCDSEAVRAVFWNREWQPQK